MASVFGIKVPEFHSAGVGDLGDPCGADGFYEDADGNCSFAGAGDPCGENSEGRFDKQGNCIVGAPAPDGVWGCPAGQEVGPDGNCRPIGSGNNGPYSNATISSLNGLFGGLGGLGRIIQGYQSGQSGQGWAQSMEQSADGIEILKEAATGCGMAQVSSTARSAGFSAFADFYESFCAYAFAPVYSTNPGDPCYDTNGLPGSYDANGSCIAASACEPNFTLDGNGNCVFESSGNPCSDAEGKNGIYDDNGICIPDGSDFQPTPACKPGLVYDQTSGTCVNKGSPKPPKCPEGQRYSTADKKCVPACAPGESLVDGKCTPKPIKLDEKKDGGSWLPYVLGIVGAGIVVGGGYALMKDDEGAADASSGGALPPKSVDAAIESDLERAENPTGSHASHEDTVRRLAKKHGVSAKKVRDIHHAMQNDPRRARRHNPLPSATSQFEGLNFFK